MYHYIYVGYFIRYMKIYVTHSTSFDFQNELYGPLRKSELNMVHEIVLPHEHSSEQFSSKEFMKECDVVLAEVSYPSTGQGIELGWANTYNVPIVCLNKKGMKVSGALKTVSEVFIEYENTEDMVKKLGQYLEK